MKKKYLKAALFGAIIAGLSFASCEKNTDPNPNPGNGGEEGDGTRWITLTGSYPDANGGAGNGGNLVYALSPENAANPNYEVNIFGKDASGQYNVGFSVKSARTARIQASADGQFLYNIQYTGADGGVFNKYKVSGEGQYEEDGYELNTAAILGTSPRWNKAAEDLGVGVYASSATLSYTGEAPNFVYQNRDSEVRIAVLDLDNTAITNTAQFAFPWSDEERAAGYGVGRIDVPVLNAEKTKIFIGCNVSKVDPTATPTVDANGVPTWPSDTENINGTKTLVLDYPSLKNPTVITSSKATNNNHGYRTTTQYVGTDGHVYQAVASHGNGHQILRISSETNDYDNSYEFNLNTVLGIDNAGIAAWKYIKDGIGVVLYRKDGQGGYIALIDLNLGTATPLATDIESDEALNTVLGQYQNITSVGDYAYVPLAPSGKDGNLYVINWKAKTIAKGAKLINDSGSFYIGAY